MTNENIVHVLRFAEAEGSRREWWTVCTVPRFRAPPP
jgi:hypothetical protein